MIKTVKRRMLMIAGMTILLVMSAVPQTELFAGSVTAEVRAGAAHASAAHMEMLLHESALTAGMNSASMLPFEALEDMETEFFGLAAQDTLLITPPVAQDPDTVGTAIEADVIDEVAGDAENKGDSESTPDEEKEAAETPDESSGDSKRDSADRLIPGIGDVISFSKIFMSLLALLFVWALSRFVSTVLTNMSERFSGYRLVIKRTIPILKVLLWSIAIYFVIAGILQPPVETIITVSASIGIAVGFASQDILRNIFGGIMIILDRPFQVGDKIQVDNQYGEVLEIGLRSVRVVTEDDSVVTVPNAEIMNKSVSNANSSALDCQVVAELFLPRDADIETVQKVCRMAAVTSRFAYLNKPVFVHTTHVPVGPRDYLKVRLKAYVLDIRFEQELRSDMTALALTELKRRGILAG